ncbi:hypothetical protein VTL71DRAFT_3944 [Oculimacula yallundae]|uniref:Uncharacterized protein n=1 Tax=Oculimacula yallundae TaxID=86028 RepID=A0ABR4C6B0_9HELO
MSSSQPLIAKPQPPETRKASTRTPITWRLPLSRTTTTPTYTDKQKQKYTALPPSPDCDPRATALCESLFPGEPDIDIDTSSSFSDNEDEGPLLDGVQVIRYARTEYGSAVQVFEIRVVGGWGRKGRRRRGWSWRRGGGGRV